MATRAGPPGMPPAWRRLPGSVIAVSSRENSSGPIELGRPAPGATVPARPGFRISKTLAHFVHLMRLAGALAKRDSS
jgi:hypothetical protein